MDFSRAVAIGSLLLLSPLSAAPVLDATSSVTIVCTGPAAEPLHALIEPLLSRYLLLALRRPRLDADGAPVRFVLHADATTWHDLPAGTLADPRDLDAFTIAVTSVPPEVRITGLTTLAVGYGVMTFLEENLRITWLFPGDLGLVLPAASTFPLREQVVEQRPVMLSRLFSGMAYFNSEIGIPFRRRYGQSLLKQDRPFFEVWDYYKSLRLHHLLTVHHNMINIFPLAEHRQENPEIFPMHDGERWFPPPPEGTAGGPWQCWHPCYSNEKTVQIAVAKARQAFAAGNMIFSLGINDGRRLQCDCAACAAVGWPESYYRFVTRVADAVRDQYPPHLIGVLVYGDVRHPRGAWRLPDNVLAQVTAGSKLSAWKTRAGHLGRYDYFYGDGFWLPSFPLAAMTRNARMYADYGVSAYYAETSPVWAFDAPKVYIMSRLFWNAETDANELLRRYCRAAFGAGGPDLARFYLRWSALWDYLAATDDDDPAPMVDMRRWRSSSAQFSLPTAADYAYAADCLTAARTKVAAGAETERLDMVTAYFGYSQALFQTVWQIERIFASLDATELIDAFRKLLGLRSRLTAGQAEIAAHPAWTLAASKRDRDPGWTLDQEIDAALVTALLALSESGVTVEDLPDFLLPYSGPFSEQTQPVSFKIYERGVYWALEEVQDRFQRMQAAESAAGITILADGRNPQVSDGPTAGDFKLQWAALGWGRPPGQGRALYRFELSATGCRGDLVCSLQNNWRHGEGDGLPVNIQVTLGEAPVTITRRVIVEPVGPDSEHFYRTQSGKILVSWQPAAAAASCRALIRLTRIDLALAKSDPGVPTGAELLNAPPPPLPSELELEGDE